MTTTPIWLIKVGGEKIKRFFITFNLSGFNSLKWYGFVIIQPYNANQNIPYLFVWQHCPILFKPCKTFFYNKWCNFLVWNGEDSFESMSSIELHMLLFLFCSIKMSFLTYRRCWRLAMAVCLPWSLYLYWFYSIIRFLWLGVNTLFIMKCTFKER